VHPPAGPERAGATDTTIRRDDADLGNDEPQWNSGFKAGTCVAAQLVVDELALVRQRGCSRMLL